MDANDIYTNCSASAESGKELIICLTENLMDLQLKGNAVTDRNRRYSRNMAVMFSASLAFFMQAGFAMVCAGAVRKKNLQNTMLKNVLDACGASIAFYAVGYAFAFGDGDNPNAFIGTSQFFLGGMEDVIFWFFQYAFSAAAATIVAGTLAERCQMSAYFYYTIFLSGFVYPVVVHAFWSPHGFLSPRNQHPLFQVGAVDVAGGAVVHVTGGATALISTWILGPRRGRFHDEQTGARLAEPRQIKGHNIGLQLLGTLILWFGWYGFNSGSALLLRDGEASDYLASLAATNTTLSAGAGGAVTLFVNYLVIQRKEGTGRFDLVATMNGVLAGLVAVTPGCAVVEPWGALIIGGMAGVLYLLGSRALVWCRLDDAVDAVPVHLVNGTWGMVAIGLFATPSLLADAYGSGEHPGLFFVEGDNGSDFSLLLAQLVGVMFVLCWSIGIMAPFFLLLSSLGRFRAEATEEVLGLDQAYFGGTQQGGEGEFSPEEIGKLAKVLEHTAHHGRKKVDFNTKPPMSEV